MPTIIGKARDHNSIHLPEDQKRAGYNLILLGKNNDSDKHLI
jgi:hypothetical protein